MSASAWRICPQCLANNQKKQREDAEALKKSYGKISLEEWQAMKTIADAALIALPKVTLREDYEIFTDDDGWFYISYYASCKVCGFKHSFKHEEQLEVIK